MDVMHCDCKLCNWTFIFHCVLVTGGVRSTHDNKVSGQLSSNSSNHNARLGSAEEYMNMAHRYRNEVMQESKYPSQDVMRC